MRRVVRGLLALHSLSPLPCVTICATWVRSYWVKDWVEYHRPDPAGCFGC